VPTRYVDAWRRALSTNQYSVTDYARAVEHGQGVPGLFFKYDIEPIVLTVRERSVPLWQFLVRLAGILGGVWTVAGFSLRVGERIGKVGYEALNGKEESPEQYARAYSSAYDVGYGAVPSTVSQRPQRPSGPTPYGSVRSTSQKWMERGSEAVVGGAREAWNAASTLSLPGQGHRKTESVQQRIFSGESQQYTGGGADSDIHRRGRASALVDVRDALRSVLEPMLLRNATPVIRHGAAKAREGAAAHGLRRRRGAQVGGKYSATVQEGVRRRPHSRTGGGDGGETVWRDGTRE